MSQQHTPEPWEVSALGGGLHANDVPICQFFNDCGDDFQNHEANARRIVACVNACAGIPNEQLECDNIEFVRIFNERNHLKQQRDELHKALQYIFCLAIGALNQFETIPDDFIEFASSLSDQLPERDKDETGEDYIRSVISLLHSVKGGA